MTVVSQGFGQHLPISAPKSVGLEEGGLAGALGMIRGQKVAITFRSSMTASSIPGSVTLGTVSESLDPREFECLSQRETEVLDKLNLGRRYKEIAADLSLSVHTVRTHLHNIYEKLQVDSRKQAMRLYQAAQRNETNGVPTAPVAFGRAGTQVALGLGQGRESSPGS